MTRTLILIRHADPDRDHRRYTDHEFPLTQVGNREAANLGQILAQRFGSVDAVFTSTAVRARQTVDGVLEHLETSRVEVRADLYLPSIDDIVGVIKELADESVVAIVAHEPAVSYATETFAVARPDLGWGFPTSGAALLTVDGEWENIAFGLAHHELVSGGARF